MSARYVVRFVGRGADGNTRYGPAYKRQGAPEAVASIATRLLRAGHAIEIVTQPRLARIDPPVASPPSGVRDDLRRISSQHEREEATSTDASCRSAEGRPQPELVEARA